MILYTGLKEIKKVVGQLAEAKQIQTAPLLSLPFKQAWCDTPEAGFEPAWVQFYGEAEALVVLAVMKDRSVYNNATQFNQPLWETGDVFETFIEVGPNDYYELHVGPENQNLFLRWSSEKLAAVRSGEIPLSEACIDEPNFLHSESAIALEDSLWTVSMRIPYQALGIKVGCRALRVSFARYDYTQGQPEPILSATPDLPVMDYHHREAWHKVELGPTGT